MTNIELEQFRQLNYYYHHFLDDKWNLINMKDKQGIKDFKNLYNKLQNTSIGSLCCASKIKSMLHNLTHKNKIIQDIALEIFNNIELYSIEDYQFAQRCLNLK